MIRWPVTLLLLLVSLVLPTGAQTNGANTSGQSPNTAAPPQTASNPAPNPPKKVWTNDDLGGASGKTSAASDKNSQKYPLSKAPDPATVDRIRKSMEKLEGQVEDIEKQMAVYRNFLKGEPVSTDNYDVNKGFSRIPVEQQLLALEKKKKDLETQIDALDEEARKKGIDPGLLRTKE
jgi:hypothetical protein